MVMEETLKKELELDFEKEDVATPEGEEVI